MKFGDQNMGGKKILNTTLVDVVVFGFSDGGLGVFLNNHVLCI